MAGQQTRGWQTFRADRAPRRSGHGVQSAADTPWRVDLPQPGLVRVRLGDHDPGESFCVLDPAGEARPAVAQRAGRTVLALGNTEVRIEREPLRISIATDGVTRVQDDAELGSVAAGEGVRVHHELPTGAFVCGFGEKGGPLDRRGSRGGGTVTTMWNTDAFGHGPTTDPLYVSVPFWMVIEGGRAYGVYVDNHSRLHLDVGTERAGVMAFGARFGPLDWWFLDGPTPADVLRRFADLTGRMPMPPRWSLGYHHCRYGWPRQSDASEVARELRRRKLPCDALWLDILHTDGYEPMTFGPEYSDADGLIRELHDQAFRVVAIVDPHPGAQAGRPSFDQGQAGGHFVRRSDGSVHTAPVWPSKAEVNPCDSAFPDFTREETRRWWGDRTVDFMDVGLDGVWNDMNEPAVFGSADGTLDEGAVHEGDVAHGRVHNAYGMLNARATADALRRRRPEQRPFVLTRSTCASGQRDAAVWTGDCRAEWSDLQQSVVTLLAMGLSGLPFVGSDVGGFVGDPEPELFTRWLQAMVFTPFFRGHADIATRPQEPWVFGGEWTRRNRAAIRLRYEFLPEIERAMRLTSVTGVPPMRALLLEFPDDETSYRVQDQWMWGDALMVAPVVWPMTEQRGVWLPPGTWWRLGGAGKPLDGGRWIDAPAGLAAGVPRFARGGRFVFTQKARQHSGAGDPTLIVHAFPGGSTKVEWVDDDGLSTSGPEARRTFRLTQRKQGFEVAVSRPTGDRSMARPVRLIVHGVPKDQREWDVGDGSFRQRFD